MALDFTCAPHPKQNSDRQIATLFRGSGSSQIIGAADIFDGAERNMRRIATARNLTVAVIAVGATAALALNLPGHLSYDSVLQLSQGRTGVYNSWHPPIMAWMLGLGDSIVHGPALFVAFDTLLLFGSLIGLVLTPGNGLCSRWAPVIAAVFAATPVGLIYPAIVWKDVLFAASALAGFTALALAAARWRRPQLRWPLIFLAAVLMALAGLVRQNGAVAPLVGAVSLGMIAAAQRRRILYGAGFGLGLLVAAAVIMTGSTLALNTRSDGEPEQVRQLEYLQLYDLSGAVKRRPSLSLQRLKAVNPRLEQLVRTEGAMVWTPLRIDTIAALDDLHEQMLATPVSAVTAQWVDLIVRHPDLYLAVRGVDFFWVVFTPRVRDCTPFFVGVDGPQPFMEQLGLVRRMSPRDSALKSYGLAFTYTPLFSHALYGMIAILVLVRLALRHRPADIALAGMIFSALTFCASFLVVSVACDYRYLYFLDVAAMAGALYLAASGRRSAAGTLVSAER